MLQFHYMAPWVPGFNSAIEAELSATNNSPPFTSFQLATIDHKSGYPKNRTLIFRGFLFNDKTNNILTCTTDKRMSKYDEFLHDDKFEAVFYFPRTKKQFRFRGKARIIDHTYKPIIDISAIQPKTILEHNQKVSLKRDKEFNNSDVEDEVDDDESIVNGNRQNNHNNTTNGNGNHSINPQTTPIQSSLLSPSLLSQFNDSSHDLAYSTLNELSHLQYIPPSEEEWNAEIDRQWENLSKSLKKTFRKPAPLQPLNDDNIKLMDSINRGVDGKKDDHGKKNFSVVALFIDQVDMVELEKDRRYIYVKDSHQLWSEEEVCP
ncbi:pyridoxamine 5'-phosphate oxidase-domain-containing protein [Scheffersomyces xylosifermentans]|uniref:pyridoxamine 5'-phosphate oxidase-domain-containing protein n=1 Tax=Scheffersomyces xylosifermentans TaxID=1304137 RepID=UPI00315D558B